MTNGGKPGFDHFVLRHLFLWEGHEKNIHALMSSGNPTTMALTKAMHGFRIARSFSGIGEEAAKRRVLGYIERAGNDGRRSVSSLTAMFHGEFDRENLSAASKLLWLRHQAPFLIYDANAVAALEELSTQRGGAAGGLSGDYGMFEDCWRAEFARSESAITAATGRIVNLLPYFEHCHRAGSLQALGEKQWFRERVFDNYLWYVGGNVLAARKQRRKQRKKRVQVGAGV